MISKEIPLQVRGRFFALSNVVGGIIGAGAAWLVSRVLVDFPYPSNFAICFGIAFVATMISMGFLFGNREAPRPAKKETHGLVAYFKRIPGLLKRDRNFSIFIACRMILTLAGMAAAFYATYAVDHLYANEGMVGIYTAILLGTQVPANLVLGYIGDKWGQRIVMQIVAVCVALAAFLAVLSPNPLVYSLVWVFVAIATSGTFLVNMAMLLEFSTPEDRPTYVAVGLGIGSPVSFAAPLLGSWLATTFSYTPLFWISGILGLLALLSITRFVVDPRKANAGRI
jgi:Na+/melibiose symporter-like transporter